MPIRTKNVVKCIPLYKSERRALTVQILFKKNLCKCYSVTLKTIKE